MNAVSGYTRILKAPVNACELMPNGEAGLVHINGAVYTIEYIPDAPGAIKGYHLKRDNNVYTVDAGCTFCDCKDSIYRAGRPGGCKHRKALKALKMKGKLA